MGVAGTGVDTPVHLLLDLVTSLVSTCSLGLFTHLVSEYRGSGPRAGKDLKKISSVRFIIYIYIYIYIYIHTVLHDLLWLFPPQCEPLSI